MIDQGTIISSSRAKRGDPSFAPRLRQQVLTAIPRRAFEASQIKAEHAMKFIIFRAYGVQFSPQQFAIAHGLKNCSFWHKPEPATSGLRISLPDAAANADIARLIQTFLENNSQWLTTLPQHDAACEFDIGMTVGSDESFTASISFDPDFLGDLASYQIGLTFSAYPASS